MYHSFKDPEMTKEVQINPFEDLKGYKETQKFKKHSSAELFFNFKDAASWLERHVDEVNELGTDYMITELELKLMPSGAYRAGIVIGSKQIEMFNDGN